MQDSPIYRPFTEVIFKSNLAIRFAYDEYDSLNAAWESKKEFFDGENEYGSIVRIKMKDIVVVTKITHEERLEMLAEKRCQNKEDEVLGSSD